MMAMGHEVGMGKTYRDLFTRVYSTPPEFSGLLPIRVVD